MHVNRKHWQLFNVCFIISFAGELKIIRCQFSQGYVGSVEVVKSLNTAADTTVRVCGLAPENMRWKLPLKTLAECDELNRFLGDPVECTSLEKGKLVGTVKESKLIELFLIYIYLLIYLKLWVKQAALKEFFHIMRGYTPECGKNVICWYCYL